MTTKNIMNFNKKFSMFFILSVTLTLMSINSVFSQNQEKGVVKNILKIESVIELLSNNYKDEIWPNFDPGNVPHHFVGNGINNYLSNWEGVLPEGYNYLGDTSRIAHKASSNMGLSSTRIEIDGKQTAQILAIENHFVDLLFLTIHESFHVFQFINTSENKSFGQSENSFLVSQYPIFDVQNESNVALEGYLLHEALKENDYDKSIELANQFLAVRESRQRRLTSKLMAFENNAEMNEGLAEYSALKAFKLLSENLKFDYHELVNNYYNASIVKISSVADDKIRSIRLRFYKTGSAIAFLLDKLGPKDWKTKMMESNLSLQNMLAEITNYRIKENELVAKLNLQSKYLEKNAKKEIMELRSFRKNQKDSMMSQSGIKLIVDASEKGFIGMCGIDPQNLLQISENLFLHSRWFRPCISNSLNGSFNTPVVHNKISHSLMAVIDNPDNLKIEIDGNNMDFKYFNENLEIKNLKITGLNVDLKIKNAELSKQGDTIVVILKK